MQHSFNAEVAARYGVVEAILIQNFQYWIGHNQRNERNQHDGRTWTYNSVEALTKAFPYLTARQVSYFVNKLVDDGVLLKGNYNQNKYDRTLWYAFSDEQFWTVNFGVIDFTKLENADPQSVETIPVPNPVPNPVTNSAPPRERAGQSGGPREKVKPQSRAVVLPWESEAFRNAWAQWKEYKLREHKFAYKTELSEQAALKKCCDLAGGREEVGLEIIFQSIANGWEGFYALKLSDHANQRTGTGGGQSSADGLQAELSKRFNGRQ